MLVGDDRLTPAVRVVTDGGSIGFSWLTGLAGQDCWQRRRRNATRSRNGSVNCVSRCSG